MKLKLSKNLVVPAVALTAGTLAAIGANSYITRSIDAAKPKVVAGETVQVVVPTKDLPKGTKLSQANVAVRQVPKEWSHSNAVTPAQFTQVNGLELVLPVMRGEQLMWAQIEGKKAPTLSSRLVGGRRAVTVSVDEISSISGMLAPGDTIDLMATVRSGGRALMVPVMSAVYVLATGTRVEQSANEGNRSYTTVTLDVTPDEAKRIMASREVGRLTALLRAPGDRQPAMTKSVDAHAELGLSGGPQLKPPPETVPVFAGRGDPRHFAVGQAPAATAAQQLEEAVTRVMAQSLMSELRPDARNATGATGGATGAVVSNVPTTSKVPTSPSAVIAPITSPTAVRPAGAAQSPGSFQGVSSTSNDR
jgi:pilus assembly protein CpaB